MSSSTAVFLQARLGSSRLPGKALMKICGRTVVGLAMDALRQINADSHVLLTEPGSFEQLKPEAEKYGFSIFAGPEDDVLLRFRQAADRYRPDTIIRATGDNPLVDSETALLLLEDHISADADYSGFDGPPLGTGVEVIKTAALMKAAEEAEDPYEHEHVCPYLYRNPSLFRINRHSAPKEFCLPDRHVTIDTIEDFHYISKIFESLYKDRPVGLKVLLPWLESNRRGM